MKIRLILALLLLLPGFIVQAQSSQQKIDKAAFYTVMNSGDLEAVDNEIAVVIASISAEKDGYLGALLMRKAGLVKRPADKLRFFKAGRLKFDPAIAADKDNLEFHFLRFAIQEHAPKIVKYKADLQNDKSAIINGYKNAPIAVKSAIADYAKKSKLLKPSDLN
ncbi:hypothetical protein [Mucilaginibacter antarcticus]|uniref:DUF4142 domain-containing protein n=1 Tax=Mucilaginibacter antarcticus TaxID=1855725 RepID=A0ABW5XTU8_9SPHI